MYLIHDPSIFFLGRPLLLPSSHASVIPFSNPSDRITCPKNPSFLLIVVCCNVSSSFPISNLTLSLVFFSFRDRPILFIFFHIHTSHAFIFFPHLLTNLASP